MATLNFGASWSGGAAVRINKQATVTEPGEIGYDLAPIAPGTANAETVVAINTTKLQAILITADQPCTIATNAASTGSPAQQFALDGNSFVLWVAGAQVNNPASAAQSELQSNPITTSITALYVSTPSSNAQNCNVSIRAAQSA